MAPGVDGDGLGDGAVTAEGSAAVDNDGSGTDAEGAGGVVGVEGTGKDIGRAAVGVAPLRLREPVPVLLMPPPPKSFKGWAIPILKPLSLMVTVFWIPIFRVEVAVSVWAGMKFLLLAVATMFPPPIFQKVVAVLVPVTAKEEPRTVELSLVFKVTLPP